MRNSIQRILTFGVYKTDKEHKDFLPQLISWKMQFIEMKTFVDFVGFNGNNLNGVVFENNANKF